MSPNQQLIMWLDSVHAIELALLQNLQTHAAAAEDHAEMRERIEQHIAETRRHAERVEHCLALLGEKPSRAKSFLGNLAGMMQGMSTGMFRDELMKNALMDYTAEQLEIASYTALIAAAQELDQPEIVGICGEILEEEEAMAEWLLEQIPEITHMMIEQVAHQ